MNEIIKDINGNMSSKRIVMFILLLIFIVSLISNLFYGKVLTSTLQDQLYYLLIWSMSIVFGEQITNIFKK